MTARRAVIIGAGAAALWYSEVLRNLFAQRDLQFTELTDPPGYRTIKTDDISMGGVPLFGLEQDLPAGLIAAQRIIGDNLCCALF